MVGVVQDHGTAGVGWRRRQSVCALIPKHDSRVHESLARTETCGAGNARNIAQNLLAALQVPADARPFIAYSDSEAEEEEEGEGSDIEDWWGDDAAGDEHSEGGYVQDSSSLTNWSSSSSSSSSSSGSEDDEQPPVSSSDSEEDGLPQVAAAGGSSTGGAAKVPAELEGLDEATRQLLLESILAGDDGALRCAWLACRAGLGRACVPLNFHTTAGVVWCS